MARVPPAAQQNLPTHVPHAEPLHRRIFVGPFPERIIAHSEVQAAQRKRGKVTLGSVFSLASAAEPNKWHDDDKVEEVARTLKEHAFKYFVHEGGMPEDWDNQDEDHLTDELVRRWKDSSWGKLWAQRFRRQTAGQAPANDGWFGESFEVGALLGVNVLQGPEHVHVKGAISESSGTSVAYPVSDGAPVKSVDATPRTRPEVQGRTDSGADAYTTANTAAESSGVTRYESAKSFLGTSVEDEAVSSVTPLLHPTGSGASAPGNIQNIQKSKSALNLRPPLLKDLMPKSDGHVGQDKKGKGKMVHYSDDAVVDASQPAAPPEVVLARTISTIDPNTSAAAAIPQGSPDLTALTTPAAPESEDVRWGDVIKRDRMLVRILYSKDEGITRFDDAINRTTRNLHYEDWGEFLVAWRKDRIELYGDYKTPGREWAVGHKQLAYVVPLKHSRTTLSLYSFVDASFCITCPPTRSRAESSTSWTLNREKGGVNIFIFKLKSRTRAFDWMWLLWRYRGGEIPPSIEVHNPRLNTKVTIDVPRHDISNDAIYQTFTRDNVIDLCMESLRGVPDWKYLMEERISSGKQTLQLAWRLNTDVDWIWLDDDPKGKPREWSVLYGVALRHLSTRPPKLEIRIASHDLTHVHIKDGARLDEPPSIEGYLDRIRPNTQTKQHLYLVAHGSCLFTLNTSQAFPPTPPGLGPLTEITDNEENLRHSEIRRGINQIMCATGVVDLRTIAAVRRAFQPTPSPMHEHRETEHDNDWVNVWNQQVERSQDDGEDEGGDVGLGKADNKVHMRMRRSFELLLTTGHIVRFEAHSCRVALEWIERLRNLIFYWKYRHRVDANQEIELAQAARPRLTPQTRVHDVHKEAPPDPPIDLSMPYPAMARLYNWCVLEGCRPIVKGGRLYMKKGLRGQFKLIQLYLVAGHLVLFQIRSHSSLYPAMRRKINLMDAYVYSGNLAAQTLPEGQYLPNLPPTPRRYQDGLETDDREEDMIFIIKYRPFPQLIDAEQDPTTTPVHGKGIPSLSAKQKILVFKTRSVLERDAWCWAINSEMEKIVRAQKPRENILRETGNLLKQ